MVPWPALPRAMTLHGAGKASTLMHPSGTLAPCTPAQMDLSQEQAILVLAMHSSEQGSGHSTCCTMVHTCILAHALCARLPEQVRCPKG